MKTKLIAMVLTAAIVAFNALPVQANTRSHVHIYNDKTYVRTTQDGSYTHSYITGVNPTTGTVTYGTCLVMCETEYYTYRCSEPGCFATDGSSHPEKVETHGSCPR